MHFHLSWSSSGCDTERFDHYQDVIEGAQESSRTAGEPYRVLRPGSLSYQARLSRSRCLTSPARYA